MVSVFFGWNCLGLQELGLGLGSTLVPYLSMLSPSMLVPWFPVSVENRDLG
jgi:hypothetical protein